MAVLTAPTAPLSPSLTQAAGPSCTLQRSGSLWQLGIESQELTTAIAQLAERLETDEPDERQQVLGELEAAKPDKTAIKEAIKAGQQIPGAQLLSRRIWRIT
jgi:hypothetical protein